MPALVARGAAALLGLPLLFTLTLIDYPHRLTQ